MVVQDLGELSCLRYVALLVERVGCLWQGVEGKLLRLFDKEWREVVEDERSEVRGARHVGVPRPVSRTGL